MPPARLVLLFFFDVLGFGERVKRLGLSRIHALYEQMVASRIKSGPQFVLTGEPVDESGAMVPVTFTIGWETTYFSDTILLWTTYQNPLMLDPAVSVACDLFCECFAGGLPLRGAMAVGEAVMDRDNGIFLGEPIIDAARAEAAMRCAGIGVARSWNRYFGGALGRADGHLPYTNHIKPGMDDRLCGVALDWPRRWRENEKYRHLSLDELMDSYSEPGFESYWDATRDFVAFSAANPAWWTDVEQFDVPPRETTA